MFKAIVNTEDKVINNTGDKGILGKAENNTKL